MTPASRHLLHFTEINHRPATSWRGPVEKCPMGDEKKYHAAISLPERENQSAIGLLCSEPKRGDCCIAYVRCEAIGKGFVGSNSDGCHGAGSAEL